MRNTLCALALALLCLSNARASHICGGSLTYQYKGDTSISGTTARKIDIELQLLIDCQNGEPDAILQDNPSFLSVYDENNNLVFADTAVYSTSFDYVAPVHNACGWYFTGGGICFQKRVFHKRLYVTGKGGRTIVYQRCCLSAQNINLLSPSDRGITIYCTIPSDSNNSSVAFASDPTLLLCQNKAASVDLSATDPDGDSVSYELTDVLLGGSDADIKPIPKAPPYASAPYSASYSATQPIASSSPIILDDRSGLLTLTPSVTGRYMLSVAYHEWRNSILINTLRRYLQLTVQDCDANALATANGFMPVAPDVTARVGRKVVLNALGGRFYSWTPSRYLSSDTARSPKATFPSAGVYLYTVKVTSDSGCVGYDTINVRVLDHSYFVVPTAFTPNGDNMNDYLKPIPVGNAKFISFAVYNRRGQQVFLDHTNGRSWDGSFWGVPQDVGTYYWEIYYLDPDGDSTPSLLKGDVTIVR